MMGRLLPKQPLTDRQRETYEFMLDFAAEHGRVPTSKEMLEGTSARNIGTLSGIKTALASKGYIRIIGYGKYELEG